MISDRLNKISQFIKDDHDVADIGSDHGLLLVLLNNRNFKNNVLGVENKIGPFDNLKKTICSINKPNFCCDLSNGLENVSPNYQTIVIAGMGFSNIKEIVLNDIKNGNKRDTFIIDCHTNQDEVRKFFYEIGYKISDETIILEDSIYYDVICFALNNDKTSYSSKELEFGPFNLKRKSDIFIKRYTVQLNKLKQIKLSIKNESRIKEIDQKINKLEEIINEN